METLDFIKKYKARKLIEANSHEKWIKQQAKEDLKKNEFVAKMCEKYKVKFIFGNGYSYRVETKDRIITFCDQDSRVVGDSWNRPKNEHEEDFLSNFHDWHEEPEACRLFDYLRINIDKPLKNCIKQILKYY
jgi:hypothetical protein